MTSVSMTSPLFTVVLAVTVKLSYSGAPEFYPLHACGRVAFCTLLWPMFNRNGVYHVIGNDGQRISIFCYMEDYQWMGIMRRGEDSDGTLIENEGLFSASADRPASSIRTALASGSMLGNVSEEFYMGHKFLALLRTVHLKVVLKDSNNKKYFAVFRNLEVGSSYTLNINFTYYYGTAGSGNLHLLAGGRLFFNCSRSCDSTCPKLPCLVAPLNSTSSTSSSIIWPGLDRRWTAVSIMAYPSVQFCENAEHLAFTPEALENAYTDLGEISDLTTKGEFHINCKNPDWFVPTKNIHDYSETSSLTTFSCRFNNRLTLMDWPLYMNRPLCIERCARGLVQYIGDSSSNGRASACLTPPSNTTVSSVLEAARACGALNMMLIDFIPSNGSLPEEFRYKMLLTSIRRHYPSRALIDWAGVELTQPRQTDISSRDVGYIPYIGVYNNRLGHILPQMINNVYGNSYYTCMANPTCGEGFFYAGFCYFIIENATAANHVQQCGIRYQGSPADITRGLIKVLRQKQTLVTFKPLVGVYRRGGRFYRPGNVLVDHSDIISNTEGYDCAMLSTVTIRPMFTTVHCSDTVTRPVLCQSLGHFSGNLSRCSIRYSVLSVDTAGVKLTLERQTANLEPTISGDRVSLKCPEGFAFNTSGGLVSEATFTCSGIQSEWESSDNISWPLTCVFACAVPVSDATVSVIRQGIVVMSTCTDGMTTSRGLTQQIAECNSTSQLLTPTAPEPCNYCSRDLLEEEVCESNMELSETANTSIGTSVIAYCPKGVHTASGYSQQFINCTSTGWLLDLEACSQCTKLDLTSNRLQYNDASFANRTGGAVGEIVSVSCLSGLRSRDHVVKGTLTCTVLGWTPKDFNLNCTHCTGSPPSPSWFIGIYEMTATRGEIGDTASYTCNPGMTTADGSLFQHSTCSDKNGWSPNVGHCNVCLNAPVGNHTTIQSSVINEGQHTVGMTRQFICHEGLATKRSETTIISSCTDRGWTVLEADIHCQYCAPLPDASLWGGSFTWDLSSSPELGSLAAAVCNKFLAVADSLHTQQIVQCQIGGWNTSSVQPCKVCASPPPTPHESMLPNVTWSPGDTSAIYACNDSTQLPWLQTTYEMTCSPTGWADCVPECSACREPSVHALGVSKSQLNVTRGGLAVYECNRGLQTRTGLTQQTLQCSAGGEWVGNDIIDCDTCLVDPPAASEGQEKSWDGSHLLGAIATYQCTNGLLSEQGASIQTVKCSLSGWTSAPQPCQHCLYLPDIDLPSIQPLVWNGSRILGARVTYHCRPGYFALTANITASQTGPLALNSTEQSLQCQSGGWMGAIHDCVSCLGAIPHPGNGSDTRNVTWNGERQEGSSIQYLCSSGKVEHVTCVQGQWSPAQLGTCGNVDTHFQPQIHTLLTCNYI